MLKINEAGEQAMPQQAMLDPQQQQQQMSMSQDPTQYQQQMPMDPNQQQTLGQPDLINGEIPTGQQGQDGPNPIEDGGAEQEDGLTQGDDSTINIINSLSDEDREAVRKYALSISNQDSQERLETPLEEKIILTKKQALKLSEMMNIGRRSEKKILPSEKKEKNINSPFSAPIK